MTGPDIEPVQGTSAQPAAGESTDRREQADPGATPGADIPQTAERDPDEWVTGNEEMTGPQKSYLHTLAHEAGEQVPDNLSKADASKLIDELQQKSGRGQ